MPHTPTASKSVPVPKSLVTRKNALLSTAARGTTSAKGSEFAPGRGARVITGGKRSVKLNRGVNKLGQKLSIKKTLRAGVTKMFPDSTRPLRREVHLENFKKSQKYGASTVGLKANTVDGSGKYSRDDIRGRGKKLKSVRSEVQKASKGGDFDGSKRSSRRNAQEKLSIKTKRKKSATASRKSKR